MEKTCGDRTQEFIEWVEELGIGEVMRLVAHACDVEAESAPSEELATAWQQETRAAEQLAQRFSRIQERMHERDRWSEGSLLKLFRDVCEANKCGQIVAFQTGGVVTGDPGFEVHTPDGRIFEVNVIEM